MAIRAAVLSSAHVHAPSFVSCLKNTDSTVAGLWDDDAERGRAFAERFGIPFVEDRDALLSQVDAAVICSENMKHADHIEAAIGAGLHVLCEKPIAPSREHADRISKAAAGSDKVLMTAFPCPFSPAFGALKARLESGNSGRMLAFNTTNRGRCPFGWFTDPTLSGGGAMIDHVVHVTDLLRRLVPEEPSHVFAQIGNGMYGKDWDDTAILTIEFPSGIFATLDSSWSRPQNYKTWGDVTLAVTCEKERLECDLFGTGPDLWTENGHVLAGTGSNLDQMMVNEFLAAIAENRAPMVTLEDGLQASRVALAGYESVQSGKKAQVA